MQYLHLASILPYLALFVCVTTQTPPPDPLPQSTASGSIKCYVCNSARDPRCGDPFNPKTIELVDCGQFMQGKNATVCRKNVQKVTLGSTTDTRTVRACGYEPENLPAFSTAKEREQDELAVSKYDPKNSKSHPKDKCVKRQGTFEVTVTYCTCHGGECNRGQSLLSGGMWGVVFSVLAFFSGVF